MDLYIRAVALHTDKTYGINQIPAGADVKLEVCNRSNHSVKAILQMKDENCKKVKVIPAGGSEILMILKGRPAGTYVLHVSAAPVGQTGIHYAALGVKIV